MNPEIVSVNRGRPKKIEHKENKIFRSSIKRVPCSEPVYVYKDGIDGDQVADPLIHGGPDKAICVYSLDHKYYWEKQLKMKILPGMFGENFSLQGLVEKGVCIGDIFQSGDVVFEVSQPRQPCFKLNRIFDYPEMACKIKTTGYSGFYMRVLEPGWVESGMEFNLLERGSGAFSVERVYRLLDRKHFSESVAHQVLNKTKLSKSFGIYISKRLNK